MWRWVLWTAAWSAASVKQVEIHPGDQVIVVAEEAELQIGGNVVGPAAAGSLLVVDKVAGDWLWIAARRGYVARRDVVPLTEAADYYTAQLAEQETAELYSLRAQVWRRRGDAQRALADLSAAIEVSPDNGKWRHQRGMLWQSLGKLDKAIEDYGEAIRLNPRDAAAFNNRGRCWGEKGEMERAIEDFTNALSERTSFTLVAAIDDFDPADATLAPTVVFRAGALKNRALALLNRERFADAVDDFTEAIRLDPTYADAYNGLAWLLATAPRAKDRDGARAVELATAACELTEWKQAEALDTLAAAQAEAGKFDLAVRTETRALTIAAPAQRAALQQRLELYRSRKPYRDQRPPTGTSAAAISRSTPR